ncbi:MAG: amidohydrolase family protein [Deltaproteobacteria bacterium]|nr:amidohydrolase family protein [Deltaproteobacteria bacterium]
MAERFDLLIRGGTVVDGTGRAPFVGDVAIRGGRIAAISGADGGSLSGDATEVLDARGLVVTPGFVDIHSHYDGQAIFDSALAPSNAHGVTTVVLGVCGIGFAPARPADHDLLVTTMESVEDIPGDVLRAGLSWEWETFPQYLDALDRRRFAMDIATHIGHVALRTYVMGQRGIANEPATGDDIAKMAKLAGEAVLAGALGFSTSRVKAHVTLAGDPVPGTHAKEDELFAIGHAIAQTGKPVVFQVASAGIDGQDPEDALKEIEWMRRLSVETKIPVSFLVLQSFTAPGLWKELLDAASAAEKEGGQLRAQVANRPFGMLLGLTTRHPFMKRPTFDRLMKATGSLDALVAELRKPEVRAAILAEPDSVSTGDKYEGMGMLVAHMPTMVYPLLEDLDYEPTAERSLDGRCKATGQSPLELFYDLMLEEAGRRLFLVPFFNYAGGDHADILAMLDHPATVLGLGDGGAHLATICDASMPTYQLSHWVKGRTRGPRLSLERAVKMQTYDTAALYGLSDRGTLEVGKRGDVNVIDLDRLALRPPEMVSDLPASGSRLLQGAVGYVATIVEGVVVRKHDVDTGARPGRLIRGGR